jgi:hypothetical protein
VKRFSLAVLVVLLLGGGAGVALAQQPAAPPTGAPAVTAGASPAGAAPASEASKNDKGNTAWILRSCKLVMLM